MAKLGLEEELHKVKAARSVDDLQRYENSFIFSSLPPCKAASEALGYEIATLILGIFRPFHTLYNSKYCFTLVCFQIFQNLSKLVETC